MLLGLGELIRRWRVVPHSGTTVLAQLASGAIGHGVAFYVIQLITLPSARRSLVVLIPEVRPTGPLQWLLHNQRGIILEHAIRRDTANVVLCRLRYRLETLAADPAGADAASGR